MSIIGETVLSVSLEMLFKKLATKGLTLFARQEQIQTDIKKWERILVKIKAVLDDADEKQTREASVRIWLVELQNLAYDIEDVLDEFTTEALRRKLLNEPDQQPSSSTSKLHKLIPTCCTKFSLGSVKFDSMMASKVAEITGRLQEIATQKDQLDLKENLGGRPKRVRKQPETTSLVIEAEVHGREDEKKEIVDLLLKDDLSSDGGLSVIPIIGMGGLGKTTLAQLVYNDKTVESHFDLKAWACVSEDFDASRVTRTILKAISPQTVSALASDDDLNSLQVKLKNGLSGKKFLFVLDDMWNENYSDWTNLRLPFVAGAEGSKIIVTTRNQGVAAIMLTVPYYHLKKLSDDDCMFVFTQHSLGTKDFNKHHQHLKEIGEELVKKCNGLPLAAKTLGGLLRGKYNPHDWKKVLNNKIWDLPEEGSDIMRALRVSYYYLPAHLKRCFSHCALLPKDYVFREKEIVLLWMAEGLLHSNVSGEEMEESGHYYFQELQSRSFFQQSRTDMSLFVMHDLINDLAQWAAGKIYFRMEDTLDVSKQQEYFKTFRHFSYICGTYDSIKRFEAIADVKNLRTFLPVRLGNFGNRFLSYNVIHLLLKLQRLRVLSLRGYQIYEIPNSIGDLKHLRHLDLSETLIETLPESINMLYNLHTLLLEGCLRLKKLCADMGNLKKLCHLNNSEADSLEEMPLGIGKLTCLKTLCYFVVGENNDSGLQMLKSLKNLQELKISRLENVKDVGDAKEAELNGKQNLNVLFLEWTVGNGNSKEPETETCVLDMLRPHENLEEFTIRGYGGTKFPIWLGNCTLANLVLLRFESCCTCTSLALVGQLPVLKQLFVSGMDEVKSVGLEFYGNNSSVAFPSLETLSFEEMHQWEDWIPHGSGQEVQVFPQLRELSLVECPNLLGNLPQWLPSLLSLVIENCELLVVCVPFTQNLCKFEINGCNNVVQRSAIDLSLLDSSLVSNDTLIEVFLTGEIEKDHLLNIEELAIHNSEELTYLWQTGSGLLQDISSLHRFEIEECHQLVSLVAEEDEEEYLQQQQGLQCRLQYLELRDCQSLMKLPQSLLSLCSLKAVEISDCPSLETLPQVLMHNYGNTPLKSLRIDSCHSLTYIAKVPPRLKRLEVSDCLNLTTLIDEGEGINNGSSGYTSLLEHLNVEDCPSLTSLWLKSELPATLEFIEVYKCSKLASLSSRGNLPKALKKLSILGLSELESITQAGLENNKSLEIIDISDCQNINLLPDDLHKAENLQRLEIENCQHLVCFPKGGLPCKKLTKLVIFGCDKLKALPNFMNNLTSLRNLKIEDCPSIESFPEDGFIFPTNLDVLSVDNEKIYKSLLELGFHKFTSIRRLRLSGGGRCDMVSFLPEDTRGMTLPTTLKDLQICNFPNLERLSSTVGKLTSLEYLWLGMCPKLQYFPENGLPATLLRLVINECPLIKETCKKDKGYWPLISHISCVLLDSVSVFDPFAEA